MCCGSLRGEGNVFVHGNPLARKTSLKTNPCEAFCKPQPCCEAQRCLFQEMLQALGLSVGKERGRLRVPMLLVASGGCAVTTARWCSPVVCLCSPVLSARLFPSLRDALDLHAKGFQSCTRSQRPSMHSQCPCPPARCGSCAPWHIPAPWASVCLPQPGLIWLQWWTWSHHAPAASTAAARCPGSCRLCKHL